MYKKDTIAAISTGMSNSGIGIVRISGEESFHIIDKIYKGKERLSQAASHTIHYGYIKNKQELIDEVLVTVMKAPRTFTGEDTVEINCHGGVFVLKKILEIVLENGARAAEPGEFTKRAFLNGKIDLSQAEAVIDIINSKNEYALKSSVSQLKGSVKKKIEDIRKKIIYHTAFIETALDDPEHISVDGYGQKLDQAIDEILRELKELIESADDGKIIKEGIQTVILGKPNVGKSSLLNILSGRNRAIVTEIEGTTRDILEEEIQIQGLNLNIIDTAGIRNTEDKIEKIGVEKAKEYAQNADLIIYIVDSSRSLDDNDKEIIRYIYNKKAIILLNKIDLSVVTTKKILQNFFCNTLKNEGINSNLSKNGFLENSFDGIPVIEISVKEEQGIKKIGDTIKKMFLKGDISFNDEIFITNMRQKSYLKEAYDFLEKVKESIFNQMPEDFYSIDLMSAYESLGNITGETIGEDLVNEIFSKFCMGK